MFVADTGTERSVDFRVDGDSLLPGLGQLWLFWDGEQPQSTLVRKLVRRAVTDRAQVFCALSHHLSVEKAWGGAALVLIPLPLSTERRSSSAKWTNKQDAFCAQKAVQGWVTSFSRKIVNMSNLLAYMSTSII